MRLKPVRSLGWIVVIGAAAAAPLAAQTPRPLSTRPDRGSTPPASCRTAASPRATGTAPSRPSRRTSGAGSSPCSARTTSRRSSSAPRSRAAATSSTSGPRAPSAARRRASARSGQSAGSAKVVIPFTVGLFVAGRASSSSRFRAATYDMAEALAVTSIYTAGLKYTVQRTRPDGSDRLSFPSGHTSHTFTLASVANAHYGPKVGVPAFALAAAVGLSRVERGKHNVSDVLAGATLGFVVGRSVAHDNGVAPRGRSTRFALHAVDRRARRRHGRGLLAVLVASLRVSRAAVFLDAGGVLVDPNWSRVSEALLRQRRRRRRRSAGRGRAARQARARHARARPHDERPHARLEVLQPGARARRHRAVRRDRPRPRRPPRVPPPSNLWETVPAGRAGGARPPARAGPARSWSPRTRTAPCARTSSASASPRAFDLSSTRTTSASRSPTRAFFAHGLRSDRRAR